MWVSRRTDYATRAILALSLEGGGPLKLEELARRTAVPQSVLEQVMPTMRTAGVVRSERGPSGGYRLNKKPEEITLERIVRLFQGPLAPISCATRHNPEPCPMTVGCTLRDVWEEVRDATISLLGGVTFADLAADAGGPWTIRRCSWSRRRSPGAGRFQGRWPSRPTASTGSSSAGSRASPRRARCASSSSRRPGERVRRVALAGEADVDRAVEAARGALDGDWGKTPGTERARLLHALADAIVANRAELAELEARNVGKAISSVKAELHQAVENFRYYASAIATIGGRSNPIGGSLLFYSLKEPVGVAGADRALELPADDGDLEARARARRRLLGRAQARPADAADGHPAGRARGRGRLPGRRDQRRPGRRADDRRVSRPASRRGQGRVHGLDEDGRRDHAARLRPGEARHARARRQEPEPRLRGRGPRRARCRARSWAIFYAAGQSCEARSRLLVEKPLYDEVVSQDGRVRREASAWATRSTPRRRWARSSRPAHRERVHGFVERARDADAEVVAGGTVPDGAGAFYPPTVVAASNDSEIAQEEVFGPVVTVIPFEDEEDAIRIANDVRYGLMATVWTGDPARGHRIAARIKAGTVGINMPYTAFPGIPFGGYKQSGFGRELGLETLELYLETKSVIVSTGARPVNPFGL